MKWFKAFSINSEVMEPIVREFGHKGHSIALIVLEEAQVQNIWELDIERLKKWTGINKRTAEKMIKLLSKFLQTSSKLCANFDQTFTKLSPNFDQTFTKVDASNPRGSIKDREIREEREIRSEREETPPTPQGENKKSIERKSLVPSDWRPNEKFMVWLRENHKDISEDEFERELSKFISYCHANGKKYIDHEAALRNWFDSPFRQAKGYTTQARNRIVPASERKGGIIEI